MSEKVCLTGTVQSSLTQPYKKKGESQWCGDVGILY